MSSADRAWLALRDNPVTLSVATAVAFMSLWRMLTEWIFVLFGVALFGLFLRRGRVHADALAHLPRAWWLTSVAFVLVSAAATVLSHGSARQLHPTWFLLFLPLLVVAMSTEPSARAWLARAASVACLIMLAQAVWQVGLQAPALERARGVWNAATSFGITAAILALACALGLASTQGADRPGLADRSLWGAGLVAGLLTVALSGSRGAALGLGAALVIVAWRMVWPRVEPRRRRLGVVLGVCGAALLVVWFAPALLRGVHDLVAYFTQGKLATSEGERLSAWRSTWDLLASSAATPWIGLGHGQLDAALRAGFGGEGNRHYVMYMPHMHNDWIDVLVMRGIPALLAFVLMQWAAVRWLLARERALTGVGHGTLALVVGYGLMAMFDAPYTWEGSPLALLCVAGLLVGPVVGLAVGSAVGTAMAPCTPDARAPAACATGSNAPVARSLQSPAP